MAEPISQQPEPQPARPVTGHSAPTIELGLADRSDRVRITISGPDRAKFLQNLTTNEVKRLAAGRGCEAFVTSLQGKTLAYVVIHVEEDQIWVRSDPAGLELALPHMRKYGVFDDVPHMRKYGVFDDVTIDDRSSATFELHLAGRAAAGLLARAAGCAPEETEYAHVKLDFGGDALLAIRESPIGLPGMTLIGDAHAGELVRQTLRAHAAPGGLTDLDPDTIEALRIAAGTPVFGKDITDKNLPQEIGRDARAISFVKGCYLGQETVARIDALGHVNQILKGLWSEPQAPCPLPGSTLIAEGKRVGVVTSAVVSAFQGRPIALGLIRTSHAREGTVVQVQLAGTSETAAATVSDLPFPPKA
jgi:folate-binding protein YgfZ